MNYRKSDPYPTKHHGRVITPELLVMHTTEGGSKAWLDKAFSGRDPNYHYSVHFCVYKDGEVVQYAPWRPGKAVACWHAGESEWHSKPSCNYWSLGFEIQHAEGETYPEAQIQAVIDLMAMIKAEYPAIEPVTHEQVAPWRKKDPTHPWKTNVWPRVKAAWEADEMTAEERKLLEDAVYYGKLARVSDVARSHDMEIIKAMVACEPDCDIEELEEIKDEDVRKVRVALGLIEEDDEKEG